MESPRESLHLLREYLCKSAQNVGTNVDSKGHSGEVTDRDEEHVIGKGRKDNSSYKVAQNLVEFQCSRSSVLFYLLHSQLVSFPVVITSHPS